MNAEQQTESKKLDERQALYEKYKADFDSTQALGAAMVKLHGINLEIGDTVKMQVDDITGTTKSRLTKRTALAEFTFRVAGGLSSLATDTKDEVLLAKCQVTLPQLETMNEKLVGPTCNNIKDLALVNIDLLAPYGITPAIIQQFADDIAAYIKLATQWKEKLNDRSGYTKKITDLFTQARLLEKDTIKKLLLNLKAIQPAAYDAYMAIIKKPSHGSVEEKPTTPSI